MDNRIFVEHELSEHARWLVGVFRDALAQSYLRNPRRLFTRDYNISNLSSICALL